MKYNKASTYYPLRLCQKRIISRTGIPNIIAGIFDMTERPFVRIQTEIDKQFSTDTSIPADLKPYQDLSSVGIFLSAQAIPILVLPDASVIVAVSDVFDFSVGSA